MSKAERNVINKLDAVSVENPIVTIDGTTVIDMSKGAMENVIIAASAEGHQIIGLIDSKKGNGPNLKTLDKANVLLKFPNFKAFMGFFLVLFRACEDLLKDAFIEGLIGKIFND